MDSKATTIMPPPTIAKDHPIITSGKKHRIFPVKYIGQKGEGMSQFSLKRPRVKPFKNVTFGPLHWAAIGRMVPVEREVRMEIQDKFDQEKLL